MTINNINPITPNMIHLLAGNPNYASPVKKEDPSSVNFSQVLTGSFANAIDADKADKLSALELLSGENDDLSGLLIDMQKAELSLNLALQIRNKLIDSYTEITRMQV